ncbi:MAG: copper chaperone PCu(A)C [Beijerinckiaceae bacterium]
MVAGGYLRITNEGSEPDRVLGSRAAFADHVEIHETSMADNVVRMRQLSEGPEIKSGQTVELRPCSHHVMFVGVKEPLKQGSHVKANFDFDIVAVGAGGRKACTCLDGLVGGSRGNPAASTLF